MSEPSDGLTPPGPPSEPEATPPPPPSRPVGTSYPSAWSVPAPTHHPEPADKGLGWTGFGLAVAFCVPCVPVAGVIVTVIALARRRFRPRWVAVVGLLVGVAATVLQALAVPSFLEGVRDGMEQSIEDDTEDARRSGEPQEVSPLKLKKGDCYTSPKVHGSDGDAVYTETVTLLPCDRKHDLEVFAVITVTGEDYPGEAAIEKRADACFPQFRRFVGIPYADSRFEVYYTYPTKQTWNLLGDRTIQCAVGHPHKQVTGTLRNRRR